MKTQRFALATVMALLFLPPAAQSAGPTSGLLQTAISVAGHACGDPTCGCEPSCGSGRDVCVATVERVNVEKECFCTETKKVCVPKVVSPWAPGGSGLTLFSFLRHDQDGCGADACCPQPRCGKVICVNDLVTKTYECEECVCKWEVRRLPPCCDQGCCGAVE